jgi:hypothetical protein
VEAKPVLDALVAQVVLDRAGIDPLVDQGESEGVPEVN